MKLQKAKTKLINRGTICLITGPDEEWLSDGFGLWKCTEMSLTKTNVRAIMEITDKQVNSKGVIELDYSDRQMYSGWHDAGSDIVLEDKGLVLVGGVEYRVLKTEVPDERAPHPIYIREDYLDPIRMPVGAPEYRLRVSDPDIDGRRVQLVAVLYDLEVSALIVPEGRSRKPDEEERRYGADRIEERIKELFALTVMSSVPEGVIK